MTLSNSMKRRLGFIAICATLLVYFQNCGQAGQIEVSSKADTSSLGVVDDSDDDVRPTPMPSPTPGIATYRSVTKNFNVNQSTGMVDVLVVVDNSGSMAYEQKNMADRFDSFLDGLTGLNWQVGITTTDYRDTYTGKDKKVYTVDGGDGKLSAYSSDKYLIKSTENLTQSKALFASTVQRSTKGSGLEQGIYATYRAIERAISSDTSSGYAANKGFLRNGASLAVIVVTDDDETVVKVDDSQQHGVRSTFKYRNFPENLQKFVSEKFPTKKMTFHSIIVKPNDRNCLDNQASFINSKGEQDSNSNEFYGHQYKLMSDLTGGLLGDVCAADYGDQLKIIGQATADQVREVLLECSPADANNDGRVDFVARDSRSNTVLSNYRLEGNKVIFDAYLPVSAYSLVYSCRN